MRAGLVSQPVAIRLLLVSEAENPAGGASTIRMFPPRAETNAAAGRVAKDAQLPSASPTALPPASRAASVLALESLGSPQGCHRAGQGS